MVKKYGDDNGGSLAALLTYYGFLAVFPLLLVLVTLLGLVVGSYPALEAHIVNSALSQFPVIGDKLGSNIKTLHRNSPLALSIGLLGLIWGSTGVSQSAQYAMAQVWNIPKIRRPGFFPRLGRSGDVVRGRRWIHRRVLGARRGRNRQRFAERAVPDRRGAAKCHTDVALFVVVYRILTPSTIKWRDLMPGAILAGVAWAALQSVGVFLMDHELRNSSQVYGFFALVLGILWWIYLAAQIVIYSAELNAVRTFRLWPRSLVQPPLTEADREALSLYALAEQRRPEVSVSAHDTTDPS